MTRFNLNLRRGAQLLRDPQRRDGPDLAAGRSEAILSAREIISARVAAGREPNGSRFEITDEAGHIVLTMPFHDAYSKD